MLIGYGFVGDNIWLFIDFVDVIMFVGFIGDLYLIGLNELVYDVMVYVLDGLMVESVGLSYCVDVVKNLILFVDEVSNSDIEYDVNLLDGLL